MERIKLWFKIKYAQWDQFNNYLPNLLLANDPEYQRLLKEKDFLDIQIKMIEEFLQTV